ncbi:MAG: Rpn family recombination-promoting nuclease/putative transposase [Treponema sp.]|nr:Rpn family recombination-promoting nuclease/putative transposase [Treponema sp.]
MGKLQSNFYYDDEIIAEAERAISEGRLLDLKNDIVFKSFFSKSDRESAYCRRRLISAVLGKTVKDTKVLNPEIVPEFVTGKSPRLDIHCVLDDGSEIDVEMQKEKYIDDQRKRSVYYACRLLSGTIKAGDKYEKIPESHQIMFTNFTLNTDEKLHHIYAFKEITDNESLWDGLQIHFIELPKLKNIMKKKVDSLSELEFWSILIMAGAEKNIQKMLRDFPDFTEDLTMATTLLDRISKEKIEWANQLSEERFERDMGAINTDIEERYQQIRDMEEKVRADEEKVRADEEKVRADEEKVRADEEKVRMAESKIRQDEEKVRMAESKIRQDEEKVRADKERLNSSKAKIHEKEKSLEEEREKFRREKLAFASFMLKAGSDINLVSKSTGLTLEEVKSCLPS